MQPDCEWLETDGRGGFACGTIGGELTRFWHGLLWVARRPPTDRTKLVSGVLETLAISPHGPGSADVQYSPLSVPLNVRRVGGGELTAEWSSTDNLRVRPVFSPRPFASWTWGGEALTFEKLVFLPRGRSTTLVRYRFPRGEVAEATLFLQILLPVRPAGEWEREPVWLHLPGEAPINLSGARRESFRLFFKTEVDCEDDPVQRVEGTIASVRVSSAGHSWVAFSTSSEAILDEADELLDSESRRRAMLTVPLIDKALPDLSRTLAVAADQFIVRRADTRATIMAGYPWFTDWGRDTMISLPPLCVRTGRYDEAKSMIGHFLAHADRGIIPNLFPEQGSEPHYNTVDATLWLFEAMFRLVRASGDMAFLRENFNRLAEIIEWHTKGTHNDVRLCDDGLLAGGTDGTQLTWMDVKVDGHVSTPRHGKAVEIQALWYNALRWMQWGSEELGLPGHALPFRDMANDCAKSFRRFTEAMGPGGLPDVLDRDGPGSVDHAIRPNQVLAFALEHNIIPPSHRAEVLRAVARYLLTPKGLRTLAPSDPAYKGRYAGNVKVRDRAYHQGTAWMWLMAAYVRGVIRHSADVPDLSAGMIELLGALRSHVEEEGCIGSASEIADGDEPHRPRGCFAQAWSVGAIIESLCLYEEGQRETRP